jgi:hypothetical protein
LGLPNVGFCQPNANWGEILEDRKKTLDERKKIKDFRF